jgi:hypothetical protein
MIDSEAEASQIALAHLKASVEPDVGEPIAVTHVRSFPTCWVVGYNTVAYIETGAISHALAGGPVFVNRATGSVRLGRSDIPAEDQLDPE